jgi:hypothetical protein
MLSTFRGADQLLPLFSYVLVKANIPYAFSESILLSDFIGERELAGELGYM